ncbi:hypothetical protein ACF0H5_012162 [Mactra antiquata]
MKEFVFLLVVLAFLKSCNGQAGAELTRAQEFLEKYEREASEIFYKSALADWAYATNITEYNSNKSVEVNLESANFTQVYAKLASEYNYKNYNNETIRKQFEGIADQGTNAMQDGEKLKRLKQVMAQMEGIYAKGEVCGAPPDYDCMNLEPGLTRLLAESKDYDQLAFAWKRWRDVAKGEMKELYEEFVQLSNEAIRDNGYNDTGEYWRSWYDSPTFEEDLRQLLEELKPLYKELHAFVRTKLQETYKNNPFPDSGHIPAHLLGNMWSQSWINVYDLVEPFKNKTSIDVTPEIKRRNMTAREMFDIAEKFFVSLGLKPMPQEFWNNSMIVKPDDGRSVVCHASAWDFSHGDDVRIKMCTDTTMDDLVTIHHEMGHIQYYLQYHDQPLMFQTGANPGFHEAIGDVMALSVSTPKHLNKIGLLKELQEDNATDINYLMLQALDKIAFLPFGYLIDQWRWSVFHGDTTPEQYTEEWWDLRCKYQGISPPVKRSKDDFDPGAKYHIPGNTPYIRYFVSFVIQFQLHQALCKEANQTGPLYKCDIYESKEAGKKLEKLLQYGASKPWPDILKEITGTSKMNADAILSYFEPLTNWLKKQNEGKSTGWTESKCPDVNYDIELPTATEWLEQFDKEYSDMLNKDVNAQWDYESNLTDYNQAIMINSSLKMSEFNKERTKQANYYPWRTFPDSSVRRQFEKITLYATDVDSDKLKQKKDLLANLTAIYGEATVTMTDGKTLLLEPGLTEILKYSRDFNELKEAWLKWRDNSGKLMREEYSQFVELSNEEAKTANFSDTGEMWRSVYGMDTFEQDLEDLLTELQPLYELLHAYVRKQLKKTYGSENFPTSGHIPAHLLGNMWAQQWNNIYDLVEPFKGVEKIDVTPEMIKQNYTVKRMFTTAEDFFTSLGLLPMTDEFWNKTIMVNPEGIQMICHASAWDFYNGSDFRIKMCTEVDMETLVTVHHEMGHIQYFQQYKDQPALFREGANPGFHEAIGDVMALSVSTPGHLKTIGLLKDTKNTHESDINFLMKMALEKIAFLPFGYLIDQWRWSVFSGETPKSKYNEKWWQLRCKYQGLSPPVERSEDDFDPGAKYHIPANVPYIRYFVSFVVQFQFHQTLCNEAGHQGPLYLCDIYKSTAAGTKLGNLLKLGSSIPWSDAMQQFANTNKMSVAPLMEYFKPLIDWLKEQVPENERGWDKNTCDHVTEGDELKQWLEQYERDASFEYYTMSEADWAYNTNINNETELHKNLADLDLSDFKKEVAENVSGYDWQNYKDKQLKRRLVKMADIGTSALKDKVKLKQLASLLSKLASTYSTAKVCLTPTNCVNLDPELEEILATSTDYDELTAAWKGWRDASGKKMINDYEKMVELSNSAVQELGYVDTGDYWRRTMYESETFQTDVEELLVQLKPLYENLHAYVRRKLMDQYGENRFSQDSGHIPAHLFGNMWAQHWNNIYDKVIPFKDKPGIDITPQLQKKGYNATGMFQIAEEFFTSLGLGPMRQEFWDRSMVVRPAGKDVVCHASAWDFYNAKDFRIKMCTGINMEDLITIHHEMGHTQYQMEYSHQPIPFRDGANPGFHEAIGDVMSLSVQTPKHLRKIGLLTSTEDDEETEINYLMLMALDKIAFLPFGYLIDQWRWSVFSGETPKSKYNEKWWQLRCKYQGISPPVTRNADDFDPGAKFHIPGNYPYIRYFVSYVIQFQFHEALCKAANQTGPLHRCDIYQSKEAGNKLKEVLQMGSSRPWPEAMEVMTGQRKMDARPIIEYFKPLIKWLEKENVQERRGWSDACPPERVSFGTNGKKKKSCVTSSASYIVLNYPTVLVLILIINMFQYFYH